MLLFREPIRLGPPVPKILISNMPFATRIKPVKALLDRLQFKIDDDFYINTRMEGCGSTSAEIVIRDDKVAEFVLRKCEGILGERAGELLTRSIERGWFYQVCKFEVA